MIESSNDRLSFEEGLLLTAFRHASLHDRIHLTQLAIGMRSGNDQAISDAYAGQFNDLVYSKPYPVLCACQSTGLNGWDQHPDYCQDGGAIEILYGAALVFGIFLMPIGAVWLNSLST